MAREKQSAAKANSDDAQKTARCLGLARKGIRTGSQYAELMSALMSDLIEGAITPQIGNAVCNAGGKLLKVAELSIKYGIKDRGSQVGGLPDLRLVGE